MIGATSYIDNIGLLCIGAVVFHLCAVDVTLPGARWPRRMLFGAILGVISAVVMHYPVRDLSGAAFDTRAGAVVIAGYFGGPVAGAVAALFGAVARYDVGGPAMAGGIVSVFLYAGSGVLFAAIAGRWATRLPGSIELTLLAAFSTVAVLPSFFVGQPASTGLTILSNGWLHLAGGNLASVLLLGLVVRRLLSIVGERDAIQAKLRWTDLARDAAGLCIWSYDIERDRLTWDDNKTAAPGLAGRSKIGTLEAFEAIVDKRDLDRVRTSFRAAMQQGAEFTERFRTRSGLNGARHVRVHGRFGGGTTGRPAFAVGVTIDETNQVRLIADNGLKGSALDSAVCGVIITDALADNAIVYVNSAFTKISGHSAAEVMGRNCRFMSEGLGEQPEFAELRAHVRAGLAFETTVLNRRRDGSVFWNSLRVSPIRDANGLVTHFIGIQEDVTEHLRAQSAVVAARDELKAVLESAPDAILTVDSRRCVATFNRAAEQLFGWPSAEIIGNPVDVLVPAGVRSGHRKLIGDYLIDPEARTGPMTGPRVVQALRRDGTTFPASVSLARYEHSGRPAVAVTARDMTEIVATRERLTETSSELARQLEAAQAANLSKNRFLANMSHELRTPLNAILGFSEMLEARESLRLDHRKVGDYAGHIHRSGMHLLELINDVLDLSKIESDAFPIQLDAYDINHIIQGAIEIIQPTARAKNISIDVDRGEFEPVLCDRRAIHQCVLNILSNSIKFSPPGSSVLTRIESDSDFLYFRISDQGPGIPAEVLAQIGQPFVRGTDPGIASIEGTGLGLAITQNLMLRQGGRLKIDSELGRGTTATLAIPHRQHPQRNVNL